MFNVMISSFLSKKILPTVTTFSLLFSAATMTATQATENTQPITDELEQVKNEIIKLNRELFILEEDLLFPASTQVAVFVSVDIGRFFTLDSIELKIDNQEVTGFLYTERQRKALEKGGIQRIYLGNLKTGKHQLTALFTGLDKQGRETKQAITHTFEKNDDAKMIELKIVDNEANYRAVINVEEWAL